MSLDVTFVDLVDQFERLLLTASLATMRKSGNGNTSTAIDDINTLRVCFQGHWYTKFLDRVEIKLILLISVERQKDVQTSWRIVAVDERVDSS